MSSSERHGSTQVPHLPDGVSFMSFIKQKKSHSYKDPQIATFVRAHQGQIWTLADSPDGAYYASGGIDQKINIYQIKQDPPNIKIIRTFAGHTCDIVYLTWSKANLLLSCSLDSTVRIWKPSESNELGVFQHDDAPTCAEFNPSDPNIFVSCTFGLAVLVWDISKNQILHTIDFVSPPTAISFSPDGSRVVVGCFNGFVLFYSAEDYSYITQFIAGPRKKKMVASKKVSSLAFIDNDLFLVATNDSRIRLYSMQNYSVIRKYIGHVSHESQTRISLSPNKTKMMVPSEQKAAVFIWPINHEKSFEKSGPFSTFRRDRSSTYEGFRLGKHVLINCAVFTPHTQGDFLSVLVGDNDGNVYYIKSA